MNEDTNRHVVLGWLGLLLLAATWEAVARAGIVMPMLFPTLTDVGAKFYEMMVSGEILRHMSASLVNMFAGYFLAAVLVIPAGIAIGYSARLRNLFLPTIEFLRPLPETAIIPLAMVLLGVGAIEKIFLVWFACARIMIINAIYGARSVDPRLIETARTYGYTGLRLIWRVVVPSASPHIMTGLRFSLAIAIIIIIGTEILGSDVGIGYLTLLMQRTYSTPEMYACIFSLCILGYLLNRLFRVVEGRVMGWYFGFSSTIK